MKQFIEFRHQHISGIFQKSPEDEEKVIKSLESTVK